MVASLACSWCCFIIFGLHTVDAAYLRYYYGSLNNYTSVPLNESTGLLQYVNVNLKSTFYVFGFNGTPTGPATTTMLSAYLSLNDRNVILLDWQQEAYAATELGYVSAVANTWEVGVKLGQAIVTLIKNGLDQAPIDCDGHSLGAQLCGIAGETTQEQDITLDRVTGLDPAGPGFASLLGLSNGLTSSRAKYVQVLHTNPGSFGTSQSIGTIDFWANCASNVQPGCSTGAIGPLNADDFCSHNLAWMLYSEALRNPRAFPAARAASCSAWQSQTNPTDIAFLGEDTDKSKTGNYYFSTLATSPYSKGENGITEN